MKHKYVKLFIVLFISYSFFTAANGQSGKKDEVEFRAFLNTFKHAVKNKQNMRGMLNFPFYTLNKESANGNSYPSDAISATAYSKYVGNLFHADVIRLVPKVSEDELSEIDSKTDDSYYQFLQKQCDPGSKMYEAYFEYAQKRNFAESYFAFVFGKVKGKYKAIAYYGKWPVKYE